MWKDDPYSLDLADHFNRVLRLRGVMATAQDWAFLAGFAGIASGSHGPATLAFVAAVVLVCAWIATVCVHAYRTA